MATQPMAQQEQGPVNLLVEWVDEAWVQGEEGATTSLDSPLQDKKAPKAEPEEDIDVLEPEVKTLHENQTVSINNDETKMENQESTRISQCNPGETQEVVTELEQLPKKVSRALETQEEPEEFVDQCEDVFPTPLSPCDLSTDEYCEREGFSIIEAEVADWISDVEVISDPTKNLTSLDSQNSQEWSETHQLIVPVDQEIDTSLEEMMGDNMTADENVTQLNFLPHAINTSKTENNTSQPVYHSASDSPDDENRVSSPPFADESEEEVDISIDIMSCQQQWSTLDISSNPLQPSPSVSDATTPEPDSALHVDPSAKQQEELLPQSQCELTPRGANQEAAQQVFRERSPPLSSVAMEPSNQGVAACQGSGCVVAVRERLSREGERTEGVDEQTGRDKGQKEGGLGRKKPTGQQHGSGLLRNSQTVQIQEFRSEKRSSGVSLKHGRMENDSCDDSQSDSGVSADFSPSSTFEGTTTISTGTPAADSKETPIEKEIRRAIQREQSLRRSRGLPNPPTSPEYVDIPLRKNILCQSLPAKSENYQEKDREFAGKKMQHEIHEEVRREEDLVKLGKVPGFYDKGTVRQIREKKELFEAFQTPTDSPITISTTIMTPFWSSAIDISTLEKKEEMSSQSSTIESSYVKRRNSLDLLYSAQNPNFTKGWDSSDFRPRGPGLSEGTSCQVIILENNLSVPAQRLYNIKPEAKALTAVNYGNPYISSSRTGGHVGLMERDQVAEEEEEPKENPFFKLRSSTNLVKVKQDIQEAQEREKELRKQRISLYGGSGGTKGGEEGGRQISMGGKSLMLSSPLNGLAIPDRYGPSSREGTEPSAARQSVGKSCVWPPAQAEEEKINRPEALQSPRTPRPKTPLVQRWESGLINGSDMEDD
ncbi:uncharacterized protein misp3 [Embiotoca jacksoni]|uniref:uncharacterized protein misp3 n=1 Tax=Embiotoca jacksoni TaxID=100190 RepID=UPI0037038768